MTTLVDMTTPKFDMTPEFEEELSLKLERLLEAYEDLLHEEEWLNFSYDTLTWVDLERLDEIPNVDCPAVLKDIKEVERMLLTIENEKKKRFEQLKFAIEEKSLQMMYNPTRVARLLDAGLISFEEAGSFENL